jgi:WD40 repeat protein
MSKPLLSPAGVVRLTAGQAESALRQLVAELDEAKVLHRRAIALLSAVAASEPHLATFDYELLVEGTVGAGEVDAFRKFRGDLNDAAKEQGLSLSLEADTNRKSGATGRQCWFEGAPLTAQQIERSSSATTTQGPTVPSDGLPQEAVETRRRAAAARTTLSVHIDHAADQLDTARKLGESLGLRLGLLPQFILNDVSSIVTTCELLGGQEFSQVQARRDDADVIVVILSYSWLNDNSTHAPWSANQFVVPICGELVPTALTNGMVDLGKETALGVFRPTESWPKQKERQGGFADALVEHLATELPKQAPRDSQQRFDRDTPLEHGTHIPGEGVRFDLAARGADWAASAASRSRRPDAVQVVDFLERWACSAEYKPYGVILGETGSGKTTAAKVLNNRLNERWRAQSPGDQELAPLSIYLDLRLVDTTHRRSPDLHSLINNIIAKVWSTDEARSIDSESVLDQVRNHGALLIFDGLDEVLVHLDDQEGRDFVRQLWRALPPPSAAGPAKHGGSPGRLLLTCRTHYFPSIHAERSFLGGEDREGGIEKRYEAVHLLPFTATQIRAYFDHFLSHTRSPGTDEATPPLSTDAAMALLAEIHNLTELAERPYNLLLIASQVERLEQVRASGGAVSLSTLYDGFVTDWLHRDDGKHQFDIPQKRLLMELLATQLWRDGTRSMGYAALDEWLSVQLDEVPSLRRWFQQQRPDLSRLVEDLRTATFVVRPGVDRFEFAHSSLLEFFLASHLARGLTTSDAVTWAVPQPSDETLTFLADLMGSLAQDPERTEEFEAAKRTLQSLGDSYTPRATELAFRYCVMAPRSGAPVRTLAGFSLAGASLRHMTLDGLSDHLLNISNCDLRGADLRDMRVSRARFDGSNLSGARLDRAELHGCSLHQVRMDDADLSGTIFRDCRLTALDLEVGRTNRTRLLRCDTTDTTRSPPSAPAILEALNIASGEITPATPSVACGALQAFPKGHTSSVLGVAYSPDGTRIATASDDNTARIWDTTTGETLHTLTGHNSSVRGVAYSPDGTRIATASDDNTARIWDTTTGETLHTLTGHTSSVLGVAYSPDGTRIATASDDNTARIWDTTTGETLHTLTGHTNWVLGVAYSPDGTRIATASWDNTARIWDTTTGETLHTLTGHTNWVLGVAYSPDGTRIATASWDNTARIWDTTTGETLHTLTGHTNSVLGVAYSPDGTRIATASGDNTARIWDTTTGETLHTLTGHTNSVWGVAYSPDGTRIATASDDNTARIWDTTTGETLHTLTGHNSSVRGVAYSPDGTRIATASDDNTARIWDTTTGETLHTLTGHTSSVLGVAYSPDGTRIATASDDNTARIWDTTTGETLHTLTGHTNWVLGVAYSPDGTRIATAS